MWVSRETWSAFPYFRFLWDLFSFMAASWVLDLLMWRDMNLLVGRNMRNRMLRPTQAFSIQ
jgi:hypothetical protein